MAETLDEGFNKALDAFNQVENSQEQTQETETQVNETETQVNETETQVNENNEDQILKSNYYSLQTKFDKTQRELKELKKQLETNNSNDYSKLAKENPIEFLQKFGVSFNDVLDYYANTGNNEENAVENTNNNISNKETELLKQIKLIQEELNNLKEDRNQEKELTQKERKQIRIQNEINNLANIVLKDNENRWEIIKHKGQEALFFTLEKAAEYYSKFNVIPDYSELLDAVENYYFTEKESELNQIKKLNKFGKLFGVNSIKKPSPTLGAQVPSTVNESEWNEEDAFKRALNVFNSAE